MQSLSQARTASILTILVGAWLLFTPIVISMTGAALVSELITGGVITLAGLVQLFWMNALPSWINVVAAIWLFVTAFIFTVGTIGQWNEVIAAIVTFVLATWDGVEVDDVRHNLHMHA